ncbi:MAG TPA: histidinol-phosphate transaminase [Candidatus Lokiarchaeia archaeon]|nr:histidinol-phosphate transaminase [Candidatus Lokiarchaeia archaeon]
MAQYVRKFMAKFKGYVPGEQPSEAGWIKLNTNENPYEPPASVINDLKNGLKELRKYPDIDCIEVKKQITFNVRMNKESALKMDNIVVGAGEDELLELVFKTFVDKNDRVVFFAPSYGMYRTCCEIFDAVPVEIPLNPDFTIPEDKATSTPGKLIILCSPNNPDGARVPNELIATICENFKGIVVVDEAYIAFAEDNALSLLGTYNNLIILRTFSKAYSLASLRIGYLLSLNRDVILAIRKVKQPYNVNLAAQVAALSSLKHQAEVDKIIKSVKDERDRFIGMLQEIPQIQIFPTESNFILIKIAVGKPDENQKINQKIFWELKKRKMLVRTYPEKGLYEFERITVGKPEDNDAFIEAFKECLEIGLQG